jgi:ABC-type transport system involved in multi-copper enzyme maturation permease subunit
MIDLIAAEWLKLSRRPLTWVLLGVFLGTMLLQVVAQAVFSGMLVDISPESSLAPQVEEYRRRLAFPGVFGMALGHLNGLGGFFAVILAAGALGSEYSWGTLRTQLVRKPGRARYLLAKLATIMLLLLGAGLLTIALASTVAAISGLLGAGGRVAAADLLALPGGLLRALFVLLPYVLLTLCFTVASRSLLVGVAGGLLYLVLEGGFSALAIFVELGGFWAQLYNLTIANNINVLVLENGHAFGLRPELLVPLTMGALPPPAQAYLVVALYSAAFLASALWLFRRRDIGGPS